MMLSRLWTGFKLFLCYLVPLLPCSPKIGELEQGDCVFVQAFGRNTLSDEDLGERIWQAKNNSDSLGETFTFLGYQEGGFDPGDSNRALAKKAMDLAEKYEIPIIAQWEVVYAIWEMERKWFFENQSEISCLFPPEQGYYATWDVKLESKAMMEERGKSNPIEVCHPAMKPRAIAIIWKTGLHLVAEGVSIFDFWKDELWVWDSESIQPWTRRFIGLEDLKTLLRERFEAIEKIWLIREFGGRLVHHPIKGWVTFIPVEE